MSSFDDGNPFESPGTVPVSSAPTDRDAALKKLRAPAILLLVLALLQAPLALLGVIGAILQIAGVIESDTVPVFADDPELAPLSDLFAQLSGPLALLTNGYGLIAAVVISAGAWQMRKAESWGLALAAAILAMIPISPGCCCCLGVPAGIYALVVLMDPNVKRAFR